MGRYCTLAARSGASEVRARYLEHFTRVGIETNFRVSISRCMTQHAGTEGDGRPLRVAFLGLGRYSGGSPIPFHLAAALRESHDVRVFLGGEARNLPDWLASGLPVDVRPVYQSAIGAAWSLLTRYRIRGLARAVERFAPDVVLVPFFHLWHPVLIGMIGSPFVVFVHDPEPHPGIVGHVFHALERRLIRKASHVVIHSSTFLPVMRSVYGVEPDDISVVPIGPLSNYRTSDVAAVPPLEDPGRPTLLFFGRIEEYKGVDVLLDAMPLVRRAIPDATLRLVGNGGSPALIERARRTAGVEVDNRWVDDAEVPAIFERADIVVLPYTTATQSGVIPVAAAFARPVVATRTGGLPEQLNQGTCGVLVDPGDAAGLAQALVDLASDRGRARALGQMLFEEYSVRRSWVSIAEAVTAACWQGIRRGRASS